MRKMIESQPNGNQSESAAAIEADRIHKIILKFGSEINNKKPIEQLVKDLSAIRRRTNKLALDVYLKSFDLKWLQLTVQLGVLIERVQKACLSNVDRAAMMVLTNSQVSNFLTSNYAVTRKL